METVNEGNIKEESETKTDGNSEKYRKYRLKQKAKMNNLQENLEGALSEIEKLKEREKKLLYALLYSHKKLSVKEQEILFLRTEMESLKSSIEGDRSTQLMLQQILHSLNLVKEQASNQPVTNVSFGVTSNGSSSTIIRTTSGARTLDIPRPLFKTDTKFGFEMQNSIPDFQSFLEYYDKFNTGEEQIIENLIQDVTLPKFKSKTSALGKTNSSAQDEFIQEPSDSRKIQKSMNSFDQLVNAAVIDNDTIKGSTSFSNSTKRPAEQTLEREPKKPGYFAEIFRNSPSPLEKR